MDEVASASSEGFLTSEAKQMQKPVIVSEELRLSRHGTSLRSIRSFFLDPWRASEQPKVAISTSRRTALWRNAIHLIPFCACILIVAFNFQGFYLGAQTTSWVTSLQFVAKAIELLAQASIASVMFMYVRTQFFSQSASPFGMLFAGLHTTNPSYLFSLEFWGAVTSASLQLHRKSLFLLFVPTSILLATTLGPSLAILLQPRHYPSFPAGRTSIWLNGTENDLYPASFTSAQIPTDCRLESDIPNFGGHCPSTQWQLVNSNLPIGSISIPSWTSIRELRFTTAARGLGGVGHEGKATIPNGAVVKALTDIGFAWFSATTGRKPLFSMLSPFVRMIWDRFDATAIVEAKQPFVKVVCQELMQLDSARSQASVAFPVAYDAPKAYTGSIQGLKSYELLNYSSLTVDDIMAESADSTSYTIKWIELPRDTFQNVSIGAILIPPGDTISIWKSGNSTITDWKGIHPAMCSIFAGWTKLPMNVSINHGTNENIKSTINGPGPYQQSEISVWREVEAGPVQWGVNISKSWAESVVPALAGQNSTIMDVLLKSSMFFDIPDPSPSMSAYFKLPAQILSALLANGMSRAGASLVPLQNLDRQGLSAINDQLQIVDNSLERAWLEGKTDNLLNVSSDQATGHYKMIVRTTADGLAYGTDGIPTKIALVLVCMYVLYIFIFLAWTVISGHSSTSWDSIGKLTTLAMQSSPTPILDNTTAGTETMEVFREPVNIRVRDDRIQIVFRSDGGCGYLETVEKNRAY